MGKKLPGVLPGKVESELTSAGKSDLVLNIIDTGFELIAVR